MSTSETRPLTVQLLAAHYEYIDSRLKAPITIVFQFVILSRLDLSQIGNHEPKPPRPYDTDISRPISFDEHTQLASNSLVAIEIAETSQNGE